MDQYASALGAIAAGKLPSQEQVNQATDWLLQSNLIQVEANLPTEGKLCPQGKRIAGDLRNIVEAYKWLGTHKNSDDILQEALWSLSQGSQASDVAVKADANAPTDESREDARRLSSAVRTLFNVLTNVSGSGRSIFEDFASFLRLGLADAAGVVEQKAGQTKETLHNTQQEVEEGRRDPLGRPNREDQDGEDRDARQKFEQTMDTLKDVGSKGIGTGQQTKATGEEYAKRTGNRLSDTVNHIVRRAQDDEEYQSALRAVFGLARKWLAKSTSSDTQRPMELDAFIDDPSGRLPTAIRHLRTLVERCAGGKSLDDFLKAVDDTGTSIRGDEDLRRFFDDYLVYAQHNLESVDYAQSDAGKRTQEDLSKRAGDLGLTKGSEKHEAYQKNLERLGNEWDDFQQALLKDPDVRRLKDAHITFSKTIADVTKDAVAASGNISLAGTTWIWQDIFDVYLPRVISLFKNIPLPRTEYVSPEAEFVFESVDISSINILPGHAHIKHITDVDVSQDTPGTEASTNVSGTTEVRLQGVQTTLHEVSFYYHDKSNKMGPNTHTGLVDVKLPAKGVDIDLSLTMLPTSAHAERQKEKRFFRVHKVNVSLSSDVELAVKKSNHPIINTAFKPVVKNRFRSAFETALTEQVKFALDFIDSTAYDVHLRSGVFKDGGAPISVAYAGALWSEIGRLRQLPGPFSGWKMMSHGVVKDDEKTDKAFAVGTEPQLLSGDKHGPKSQFMEKKGDGDRTDVGTGTGGVKQQGKEVYEKGKSFKQRVDAKQDAEWHREGWRSDAFSLPLQNRS